ncbi:MAG: hypothetical protein DRJ38_06960 [Thermoprotei archaeon]|nr:MAG: hypothetical protein DRJ38_06960 [Thermoprotei archaeon]
MEDKDLELLIKRKMIELQKRALLEEKKKEVKRSPWDIVKPYLTSSGEEMLEKAKSQYPRVSEYVIRELAKLVLMGRLREKLNAEDIYAIFYNLGFPIRIETRIVVKRKGKVKSISELLKEEEED